MVALVSSLLVLAVLLSLVVPMAKRRPVGTPLTWGEAMVAGVWSFFLMFWVYGVIPHLWLTWADNEYMNNTFGITAAQAARSRSGLARYDAGSGLKDVGVDLGIGYMLTDSIHVTGQVGYSRLLGDAADSPLVTGEGSADQFSAMLGLAYRW